MPVVIRHAIVVGVCAAADSYRWASGLAGPRTPPAGGEEHHHAGAEDDAGPGAVQVKQAPGHRPPSDRDLPGPLPAASQDGRAADSGSGRGGGDRAGLVRRRARRLAQAPRRRARAVLPAPVDRRPVPGRAAAARSSGQARTPARARPAQRPGRGEHRGRAVRFHLRAVDPAAPGTGGRSAAVLRRPARDPGRLGDRDQRDGGQGVHLPGHVRTASRAAQGRVRYRGWPLPLARDAQATVGSLRQPVAGRNRVGDVMAERPYDLVATPEGVMARVRLRGTSVLSSPLLNRGTAFTLAEREALGLTGLLPEGVSTIDGQLRRVYGQYQRQPDDLAKNLYLASLRDRNEVLFYRLLTEHISEMLPIVYTPTIGTAIERYSYEFGRRSEER